jgi:high affinity sulfate transporter 1
LLSGGLLLDWAFGYRRESLSADVIAGLVTAAVVIPKAMAYATVAGLPVEVGLATVLTPMLVYALFGTSRVLSVSTTTTLAILAATDLSGLATSQDGAALMGASAALAILTGVFLTVGSILRLGFVANFISEPVLVGFKAGIGLVIVLDQLPKVMGVHIAKGSFVHNLVETVRALPHVSAPTLAVGLFMIGVLVALHRFLPRAPAPLIAVAAGIAGAGIFGWQTYGIESIGRIPRGLPAFTLPDLSQVEALWPGALAIALMSFTETIAAGRAFASTDDPPVQPNRELLATGLANIGGALFGAMVAGGGTSQTAVNRHAGARTQLAGMVTAGATIVTMLLLADAIGLMPQATLAAIVIVYSVGLISPHEFRAILTVRRTEFLWAIAALGGVVVLGTLKGILVAIVLSLVALAHQTASPPVHALGRKRDTNVFRARSAEHPDDETFPGLLLVRPQGRIYFVNASRVGEKIMALVTAEKPRVVAIDMSAVTDLEYTALNALQAAENRLRTKGVAVWLVGLNPDVLAVIQRSTLGGTLGRDRLIFSLELAVSRFGSTAGAATDTPVHL